MTAKDRPVSKPATDAFREGHDRIFGKSKWIKQFDEQLRKTYLISISDSGWTEDDLFARWGDTDPVEAVFQFGDKYGLMSAT